MIILLLLLACSNGTIHIPFPPPPGPPVCGTSMVDTADSDTDR